MNKQTIKVAVISVISTLAVVALVAYIAIPKVIDAAKATAVSNFDDEYEEAAYILSQSEEPVLQPNYIITGLIMSPDFQEYLDEGVQNGWWTEDFLAEFLVDESLPIFFTNYHQLFSAILNSDPVQNAADKLTFIKSKVQDIISTVKLELGRLNIFLNSPAITNIKSMIGTLESNKDELIGLVNTLNDLKTTIDNLDTGKLVEDINNLKGLITTIQGMDEDKLLQEIDDIKQLITTIKGLDQSKVIEVINTLTSIANLVENGDVDGILGEILTNILNSDAIQAILDNLKLTIDNVIKFIDIYLTKFIDYDYDYNFYKPVTIAGNTLDLSKYALLLNVIDAEIPEDAYVYDNNGTALKLGDDTITINTVYVGFEVDENPSMNILSEPIVIKGSDAILVKNFIPTFNKEV